ncbi:transposase [Massilia endophytica]|uniref:transposase n=1 Tax=Massilia endophytica TaxID=2899220 RepID=UPI001E2FB141|nr:transposase [Massilia endophytica]UGQ46515.1 transposase [Massilia endophytica]
MARLPRLVIPSQPHYIIQRGLNGLPVFQDSADYEAFIGWMRGAAKQFKVAVHAYSLLPGELHLLATPADEGGLAGMMQLLGRYYVPYYNQKYARAGTLWHGRYKTSVIDAANYLLLCSRYIELAPVRAGLAGHPEQYAWSSYAHHVGQKPEGAVTDHALYWGLGNTPFQREAAYTELSANGLGSADIKAIESAVLKGWPLGSDKFKTELEHRAKRQVLPAKRGRPFKKPVQA